MDKIVSVRMPSSLLEEIREVVNRDHYLDVSEAIRSLLRQRYLDEKNPVKSKVTELKHRVSDPDKILALKKTLELLEEINELQ